MLLLFLSILACHSGPEIGSPEYGAWPEHPCHSCHEVVMPFFLEATSGTSGDAAWSEHELADDVLTTQGDILYRNATGLARLPAGAAGQVLTTAGAGANPSWAAAGSGGAEVLFASTTTAVGVNTNETAFDNPYTIAANTLAVGDVYSFSTIVPPTALAGSKDFITVRVRLGGVAGVVLGATLDDQAFGTDSPFVVQGWFRVLSLGAGGTIMISSYSNTQTTASRYTISASTALDTTVDQDLVATYEGENGTTYTMGIKVWKGSI